MFFTHDIFSPPDMGGPLGELGNGDLQPWQPQVVPEVAPGGELFAPRAIAEVNPMLQPFAPKPLPITGTMNVVPRTTVSTARVPVPLLTVPKGGTQRPLFLPGGSPPSSADGGIMIPVPGQAPAPTGPSTTPAWVMPVAIGAGALLLGYLIFGRKKTATPNSRGWSRTEREARGRRKKARRRHGRRRHRVLSALHNGRRVKRRRSKTGARVARAHWMAPNPKRPWYLSYTPSSSGRYKVMRGGHEVMRGDDGAIRWAFGVMPPPAPYTLVPLKAKARSNKGKPRIVSGHPATRRCPHCGGAHSRSAHWSHMRGHHRSGPKGGSFYGHVR